MGNLAIGSLGARLDVDSKRIVFWKGALERDSNESGEVLFIEGAYVPVRVILVCEQGFDSVRSNDDAIRQIKSGRLYYYSLRSFQTFCLARKSTVRLMPNNRKVCRVPSLFQYDFVPVFGQNGPMLWLGSMGSYVDIVYIGGNSSFLYAIRSMSQMIPTLRFTSCPTLHRLVTNYKDYGIQELAIMVLSAGERGNADEICKIREIQFSTDKPRPVIIKIAIPGYFDEKRENSSDVDARLAQNVVRDEYYSLLLQGIILYFNRRSISALSRSTLRKL